MFRNRNRGRNGRGYGRGQGNKECICPQCKTVLPHNRGTPCFQMTCPKCNSPMMARLNIEDETSRK